MAGVMNKSPARPDAAPSRLRSAIDGIPATGVAHDGLVTSLSASVGIDGVLGLRKVAGKQGHGASSLQTNATGKTAMTGTNIPEGHRRAFGSAWSWSDT